MPPCPALPVVSANQGYYHGSLKGGPSSQLILAGSNCLLDLIILPQSGCPSRSWKVTCDNEMSELVPKVDTLHDVYAGSSEGTGVPIEHQKRWNDLMARFQKTYGQRPDFVSRSPGRVNIIGEHVDYSLYNVLPMAVAVDVLIAVYVVKDDHDGPVIKIANINSTKYPAKDYAVPLSGEVEVDTSKHSWTNYFLAGLRGALRYLRQQHGNSFQPRSMQLLIDGNVPAGGGLSSSAAFVCASTLAVMAANDHEISKQDLLDLCIVSERAVGVFSGGMDQAASIFSRRGFLLYCQFFPKFSAEHVPVPDSDPEITFLVAQSFVTSDKAVTAPTRYNLRVVECTLASVVLAKLHDITLHPDDSPLGFCLRNVQEELMTRQGRQEEPLISQIQAMVEVINSKLNQERYTRQDIANILGVTVETLEQRYMSRFPVQAEAFKLKQRALHVVQEASRVLLFKDTLTSTKKLDEEKLRYLGDLMNKTQASCRDVYECSCPEIDEICSIARNAGAYGSRLTGAGWGGCTVHLIPQPNLAAVMEALKEKYYFRKFHMTEEKLHEAIVISKPSRGSSLIIGPALDAET